MSDSLPKLMDTTKAAEYLGISPTTLTTWRCTRQVDVPFVKVGRVIRYTEADLGRFVEQNRVGGEAAEGAGR